MPGQNIWNIRYLF